MDIFITNGKKILLKKFELLIIENSEWREHPCLNKGPLDQQSNALTLSYASWEQNANLIIYIEKALSNLMPKGNF